MTALIIDDEIQIRRLLRMNPRGVDLEVVRAFSHSRHGTDDDCDSDHPTDRRRSTRRRPEAQPPPGDARREALNRRAERRDLGRRDRDQHDARHVDRQDVAMQQQVATYKPNL